MVLTIFREFTIRKRDQHASFYVPKYLSPIEELYDRGLLPKVNFHYVDTGHSPTMLCERRVTVGYSDADGKVYLSVWQDCCTSTVTKPEKCTTVVLKGDVAYIGYISCRHAVVVTDQGDVLHIKYSPLKAFIRWVIDVITEKTG